MQHQRTAPVWARWVSFPVSTAAHQSVPALKSLIGTQQMQAALLLREMGAGGVTNPNNEFPDSHWRQQQSHVLAVVFFFFFLFV